MAYQDLRAFLAQLTADGELTQVEAPAASAAALSALAETLAALDGPAILLAGLSAGEGQLLLGMAASWRRLALFLGLPARTPARLLADEYGRRWDHYPLEPSMVAPSAAPCKQVVRRGAAAALTRLPIAWPLAPPGTRPWRGTAVVVTRDEADGALRVGVASLDVGGPRELLLTVEVDEALASHLAAALRAAAPVDVAAVIGNEPSITLSAATDLPGEWDKYAFASALKGSPVVLTECEGSDLEVPAHAEVVVEGRLRPSSPPAQASGARDRPAPSRWPHQPLAVEVHTLTHRREPIYEAFQATLSSRELDALASIPGSVALRRRLQPRFANLEAVFPLSRDGRVLAAVLREPAPGEARELVRALGHVWAGASRFVFVVDADVEPSPDQFARLLARCPDGGDRLIAAEEPQTGPWPRHAPARLPAGGLGFDATRLDRAPG